MTILIKMTLFSKKGSSPILRDTANSRNQNAQSCNKPGCSAKMNSTKGGLFGGSEKTKSLRPLFRSSSGKEIVGSSSRASAPESSLRKPIKEPGKKLSSQPEADSSLASSLNHDPGKDITVFHPDNIEYTHDFESSSNEAGKSSVTPSTKKHRNLMKNTGPDNKNSLPGSSVSTPAKSTSQATKPSSIASRYGLRSLRCNSASDIIPSELNQNKKKVTLAKRNADGESSSSFFKGKKRTEQSLERRPNSNLSSGLSISDSSRTRNWLQCENNGNASLRGRRAINGNPRLRLPHHASGNILSQNESIMAEMEVPITVNGPGSSLQVSADIHSRSVTSFSRHDSSSSGSSHSRFPCGPSEVGITRSLTNQDNFQRYNMNGIAEVLLALDRIEQDEELSYEQLLALETSLFLNGLSFHDQHRDMRLDIDNMSYEELLALEDKMGAVSTALTEDAIEKCLKSSIYQSTPLEAQALSVRGDGDDEEDDIKCSICQEEYEEGDEVGKLVQCEHGYHLECINHWLSLKNWCPICKLSAAPS